MFVHISFDICHFRHIQIASILAGKVSINWEHPSFKQYWCNLMIELRKTGRDSFAKYSWPELRIHYPSASHCRDYSEGNLSGMQNADCRVHYREYSIGAGVHLGSDCIKAAEKRQGERLQSTGGGSDGAGAHPGVETKVDSRCKPFPCTTTHSHWRTFWAAKYSTFRCCSTKGQNCDPLEVLHFHPPKNPTLCFLKEAEYCNCDLGLKRR